MSEFVTGLSEAAQISAAQINTTLYVPLGDQNRPMRIDEKSPGVLETNYCGIFAPSAALYLSAVADGSKGVGDYYVALTFWREDLLLESNPSPAAGPVALSGANRSIQVTGIGYPSSLDYASANGVMTRVTHVKLYCTEANPSFGDEILTDIARGRFYYESSVPLLTAITSGVTLSTPDNAISSREELSVSRYVSPDTACVVSWKGFAFWTGQGDYDLSVLLTQDSTLVTMFGSSAPSGIVGREIFVQGVGGGYFVDNWYTSAAFSINRKYSEDGVTAGSSVNRTLTMKGDATAVYRCLLDEGGGFASTGVARPDYVPRDQVHHLRRGSGQPINGLIATRDVLIATSRTCWGFLTDPSQGDFRVVEDVGFLANFSRNLCKDAQDRVYAIRDNGIHQISGPYASENISAELRDLFVDRPSRGTSINRSSLANAVLAHHPQHDWLFFAAPPSGSSKNTMIYVRDMKTERWFEWEIGFTLDVQQALIIPVNGAYEMFIAGTATVNGTDYPGHVWRLESGYQDQDPTGTSHDIEWEVETQRIEGARNELLQPLEANVEIDPISGGTGTYSGKLILDRDTSVDEVQTPTMSGRSNANRHGHFPLPMKTGRAIRFRVSGTVGSSAEEIVIREFNVAWRPVSRRMR